MFVDCLCFLFHGPFVVSVSPLGVMCVLCSKFPCLISLFLLIIFFLSLVLVASLGD